jgi:hypothetical protein
MKSISATGWLEAAEIGAGERVVVKRSTMGQWPGLLPEQATLPNSIQTHVPTYSAAACTLAPLAFTNRQRMWMCMHQVA